MSPLELVGTIISAAGGSAVIVAGLAAWLGKVWAERISEAQRRLGEVDLDLRKRRIPLYAEVWKLTSVLPKWPRDPNVTYENLLTFSEALRDWYFHKGGMYISRSTHEDGYAPLQDTLEVVLSPNKTGRLSDPDYEAVRERCSNLRTHLAGDIESRREGLDPKI